MVNVEDIYASMVGELIEPLEGIDNEYAPGSLCDRLYCDACAARARLYHRLGVTEDPDLEVIFDNFCDINTHLCRKMFEHGMAVGKK